MDTIFQGQRLFLARLATGLIQGVALYLLYRAADLQSWPATNGQVFAPLVLAWIYAPLVLTLSLGEMPWAKAALWTAIAALALTILGWCDNWQAWPLEWVSTPKPHLAPVIVPSFPLFVFGGAGLFIAHALVIGGYQDSRFMARYSTHFDVAWKLAVQLALAALFVGAFWLLLWLGASLFGLIKLDFFHKLITHEWFAIPVIALTTACALHLTDIRPVLVRGARTLLLALLSWLLPLIALIVAGFLVSLPFTGLAPLWAFGHASGLLLTASAALIVLINATHQDGTAEPPTVLRRAGTLAAALPLPLVLIAGYALWLRVDQYGWTASRVAVAACVIVAISYAVGYFRAALARGPWLGQIEHWNFYVSLLILAVLFALFTPIASPLRIGVADQMAHLASGKITPAKFDIYYLRREGGRYGLEALRRLSASGDSALRLRATDAMQIRQDFEAAAQPAIIASRIKVWPHGQKLPASFLATDWSKMLFWERPACMNRDNIQSCDAVLTDLDGDGDPEILLMTAAAARAEVFAQNPDGIWSQVGIISLTENCGAGQALRDGHFALAPPRHAWKDVMIGQSRLSFTGTAASSSVTSCPH